MSHITRKLVETLNGTGRVVRGDNIIATVQYGITIYQEMHHEGNEIIPGILDIGGQLLVINGERDLVNGEEMILVLKDGRKARFLAHSGTVPRGDAQIHINEIA